MSEALNQGLGIALPLHLHDLLTENDVLVSCLCKVCIGSLKYSILFLNAPFVIREDGIFEVVIDLLQSHVFLDQLGINDLKISEPSL